MGLADLITLRHTRKRGSAETHAMRLYTRRTLPSGSTPIKLRTGTSPEAGTRKGCP